MISTTNRSNWSETFTLFNPLSFENEMFTFFSYCFSVQDAYWQHLKIDVLFTKLENLYEKVDPESENRHTIKWRLHYLHGKKINFVHRKVRFSKVQNWSHWPCHPSSFSQLGELIQLQKLKSSFSQISKGYTRCYIVCDVNET